MEAKLDDAVRLPCESVLHDPEREAQLLLRQRHLGVHRFVVAQLRRKVSHVQRARRSERLDRLWLSAAHLEVLAVKHAAKGELDLSADANVRDGDLRSRKQAILRQQLTLTKHLLKALACFVAGPQVDREDELLEFEFLRLGPDAVLRQVDATLVKCNLQEIALIEVELVRVLSLLGCLGLSRSLTKSVIARTKSLKLARHLLLFGEDPVVVVRAAIDEHARVK